MADAPRCEKCKLDMKPIPPNKLPRNATKHLVAICPKCHRIAELLAGTSWHQFDFKGIAIEYRSTFERYIKFLDSWKSEW